MSIPHLWHTLGLQDRRNLYIALTLPLFGSTIYSFLKSSIFSRREIQVFPSPRHSLQELSTQDLDDLPYPPSALPGARDVATPFGSIRVYEWGPEDGRKVLFIHGISTPCIAFAGMAKALVERGCRVMLFDLFGRGYSDTPDPAIWRQGMEVWGSQILMVCPAVNDQLYNEYLLTCVASHVYRFYPPQSYHGRDQIVSPSLVTQWVAVSERRLRRTSPNLSNLSSSSPQVD